MIVGGATLDLVGCTSVPLLHLYMYVRLPARAPHRKVARTRLPVTQERYAKESESCVRKCSISARDDVEKI